MPTVSVMDMVIHPRDHDLVVGTHGRAVYVIDDIRPLRELSDQVAAKPLHLFAIADTQQHQLASRRRRLRSRSDRVPRREPAVRRPPRTSG